MIRLLHPLQFFRPLQIQLVAVSVSAFLIGLLLWTNLRRSNSPLTRAESVAAGTLWTAFCTFEYWMLGPLSALGGPDEFNNGIPWLYFLTRVHDGGQYAHGFAGGIDAGTIALGTQYLSTPRLLFTALPLWIAVLALKAGAIGLAYAGGHRVARAGFHVSRGKSAVVGMVASAGHLYNFIYPATPLGWGLALLPWGFYVLCLRTTDRWYYVWVLVFATIYSASTSIIHSLPALYVAVLISSVLVPPANIRRFLLGCVLLGGISVLNWLDVLYGLVQLSAESARTNTVPESLNLLYILWASRDIMVLPVGFVAFGILAWNRDRFVLSALPLYALAVGLGTALSMQNWRATDIGLLFSYRWELVSDGFMLVGLLILSRAFSHLDWTVPRRMWRWRMPPLAAVYFASVAVFAAADEKALNIINYQGYGGQAFFDRVAYLARCNWRPSEPFRLVSLPSFFSPSTPTAYGIDTFDGAPSNFSQRRTLFFGLAVKRPADPHQDGHYHWLRSVSTGGSLLAADVNIDGLRIANVRYVLSDRPLVDPRLVLVSGTCAGKPFLGISAGFDAWLRGWAPRAAVNDHYIYELPRVWPRVFVPTESRVSTSSIDEAPFYQELLDSASDPVAVISRTDAHLMADGVPPADTYALDSYRIVRDGFDIVVNRRAASSTARGVVVVNAPYSRFWHASSDGRALKIVPVNGVQMEVILVNITSPVEVRYQRPTVASSIARVFRRRA